MNVSWLTLRDLEYVVAVAKLEHFGRAAKECHVSQPSLSSQIKKIEGYLGTSLFERNNRRVSVTDAGRVVTAQAQVILDEARKIPGLLNASTRPFAKDFKLGVISTLAPLVPCFLGSVKKELSGANLILREGTSKELIEELKSGELDALIGAKAYPVPGMKVLPLFFEPFVLAAPKGHAILDHKELKGSYLKASEMVLLGDGHCLRDQAIDICPTNRRGNIQSFHVTSLETLRHLVASGLGYTLLPKLAAREQPMKNLVTYREFSDPRVGREVILATRDSSAKMREAGLLQQIIRKSLPRDFN
jgi:LysR family hydrogen peroxide-inducible transcriptional activator